MNSDILVRIKKIKYYTSMPKNKLIEMLKINDNDKDPSAQKCPRV